MAWVVVMWKAIGCVLVLTVSSANGQSSNDYFRSENASREGKSSESESCLKTSWELLDTTSGRYRVTYDVPQSRSAHRFKAELRVNESVGAAQCNEDTLFGIRRSVHTIGRALKAQDWHENCTDCDKSVVFDFQFVFPGCYKVGVTSESGDVETTKSSCPKFLKPEYRKQLLVDPVGWVTSNPETPAILKINMSIQSWNDMFLVESKLIITSEKWEKEKQIKGNSSCEVSLWPNKTVTCECDGETPEQPKCGIEREILTLHLSDVLPGNYTYYVKVDNELDNRCALSTVWTTPGTTSTCLWTFNYMISEKFSNNLASEDVEISLGIYYVAIGGIILVVILTTAIVGCVGFRYLKTRTPRTDLVDLHENGAVASQRPAILVLYSRDCEAFMHLMTSFRQLLKEFTDFEIYDCYDADRWSELSLSPSAWMQRLVTSRSVRVIVVASRCASLRQRARLTGDSLLYARPQYTDELFSYGLQMLIDRTAANAYQDSFVVRFDGFSDDNDLFDGLNSYTRFVLPEHLDKLLKQLFGGETNESLLKSRQVETFRNDLNTLVKYKQEHANYLDDFLVVKKAVHDFGIRLAVSA